MWRRRTVVLAATGLGLAGLAAALLVALGSFSAATAYAVTTNPDASITITLSQFSALPALNRELARKGLPLKAVPVTAHCAFLKPGPPLPPLPFTPPESHAPGVPPTDTITLGTSELSSEGAVGVIGVSQTTSGRLTLIDAGARSPGPSCINSAAFYFPWAKVTPLPVARGKHVTLVAWVRPRPVRRCTITVWDKSGTSHAQGLYPKRPLHARVSWTWIVPTNTNLGKHRIIVRCGSAGSLRTNFRVKR